VRSSLLDELYHTFESTFSNGTGNEETLCNWCCSIQDLIGQFIGTLFEIFPYRDFNWLSLSIGCRRGEFTNLQLMSLIWTSKSRIVATFDDNVVFVKHFIGEKALVFTDVFIWSS